MNTDMEDAHTHILSLPGDQDTCFFGVFDGHGGWSCPNIIVISFAVLCTHFTCFSELIGLICLMHLSRLILFLVKKLLAC